MLGFFARKPKTAAIGRIDAPPPAEIHTVVARAYDGDAEAQFELGQAYLNGTGVLPCLPDAAYWYRQAAERGHIDAALQLSALCLSDPSVLPQPTILLSWRESILQAHPFAAKDNIDTLFPNGVTLGTDLAEGLRWLTFAANQGNGVAQFNMGLVHSQGLYGQPIDNEAALAWFLQSAERGYAPAQHNMGLARQYGQLGLEPDLVEAAQWYRRAGEQGHSPAQLNLGCMYMQRQGVDLDYDQARDWFERADALGNPAATLNLGLMAMMGQGCPVDHTAAQRYFVAAYERGQVRAAWYLASLYARGQGGLAASPARALEWYRRGAERGDVDCQVTLAQMYGNGSGVKQDIKEAAHWFRKAAELGIATAQHALGLIHLHGMLPDGSTPHQAADWFRRAADTHAHVPSLMQLAAMHLAGNGVERSVTQARDYFIKAARQRHVPAMLALARMDDTPDAAPGDLLTQAAWLKLALLTGAAGADYEQAVELLNRIAARAGGALVNDAEALAGRCARDGTMPTDRETAGTEICA